MPIFNLQCTDLREGAQHDCQLVLSDEDWAVLLRASAFARELDVRSIFSRMGESSTLTMRWEEGVGLSTTGTMLEWTEAPAVLHKMRPFVLAREATSFRRLCNILARGCSDTRFRESIDGLKSLYLGSEIAGIVEISVDGELVNSPQTLEAYLNGFEYHRDEDKRRQMERLCEVMPEPALRGMMLMLVVERLKAILGIAVLIETLQGNEPGVRLEFPKLKLNRR